MIKVRLEIIILLLLTFGFISCSDQENHSIIINGKIEGEIPEKIEFTTPINGKWYYGNKKSIQPDSTGEFRIELESGKPSFVTLYLVGKANGLLLTEPGKSYNVKFDLNAKSKKFIVTSQDSLAQNYYNTLPTPDFYMIALNQLYRDSIPSEVSSKISSYKEKEISKFNELLEQGSISKQYHALAVHDRNVYFDALETGAASILLRKYLDNGNPKKIDEFKKYWDKKIDVTKLNQTDNVRSPWFYALVYNTIWYNYFSSKMPGDDEMTEMYETAKRLRFNIDEVKKYLSGESLEYYLASFIFLESWQTKDNSKEIIKIYDNFKKAYPENPYNEYIADAVIPIIDFHNKIEKGSRNDKIQIVDNQEQIDTFDELIEKFRGKKVFVDIWGTWCGPCKKEFEHKDKYAELLESKEIKTLYICEGNNSREKIWNEMINFYELEGYHILANEKLVSNIFEKFGNQGSFTYPRYLLIDEIGKVVNPHASYPSKTDQLEREINQSYVW
ncbi:redoxin family protein [Echinicola sp. CAU 1574]|uniref:Redoxin family protein n=1 Tax=Echinicola arenosa TaxID=2774144 RepID=A0ABR9AK81_9BACT|nr:TlpA family protein disulfide reductase [Echinicola arenosa]MBD8489203.1 redoxin family protein [Echinicola arenosa]